MKTLLGLWLALGVANAALAAGTDTPSFHNEAVRFTSGRFSLVGALLTPESPPPHPVIIYVWGSGPTHTTALIQRSAMPKQFLLRRS